MDNKDINTDLEAWLSFLSFDDPSRIVELITRHPYFKAMYQDLYNICRNVEEVMNMYSKELAELDRNTVKLMIDEMQEEKQKDDQLQQKDAQLQQMQEQIKALQEQLHRG
jgi:uncharacterized protein YfeS